MNQHEQMLDEIASYVLGTTDASVCGEMLAHLDECDSCLQEYHRLRAVVDVLPLAAADPAARPAPNPYLKRRIMANVRPVRRVPIWLPYAIAATFAAAAFLANSYQKQVVKHDVVAASAHHYLVAGGEVIKNGARLYISLRNLSKLPRGKVYQAWVVAKGQTKVAPSITFLADHGTALVRLPVDARVIAAVAVSVEPAGGSKQPTSKPLFVRRLS